MRFVIAVLAIFTLCCPGSAMAQKAFDTCEKAHHTGDLISCLSKQYEKSGTDLNAIFLDIEQAQSDEALQAFRDTQTHWVIYRDNECAWEKSQAENESLWRVEELTCLIQLTEQREQTLGQFSKTLSDKSKNSEEYLPAAPWMNVILSELPDTYLRYDTQMTADLNCNGENEKILLGQALVSEEHPEAGMMYKSSPIIVVATTPSTGKPKIKTFSPALLKSGDTVEACPNDLSIAEIAKTREVDSEEPKDCVLALELKAKNCQSQYIQWDMKELVMGTDLLPQLAVEAQATP